MRGFLSILFVFSFKLMLCQNLALNKPTIQSSIYGSFSSNLAVDGDTNGDIHTHTQRDLNSFWRLDLESSYLIQEIKIFNRSSTNQSVLNRLIGFQLYVGDIESTNPSDYTLVSTLDASAEQSFENLGVSGRYIMVYGFNKNEFLSLAEVEVYGTTISNEPQGPNLALNKLTEQSSTYGSATSSQSSNAVDGNTNGDRAGNSTTHTLSDDQMWWKVDLGSEYSISEIKAFNRTDCCSSRLNGAEVFVGSINSTNPSDYTKVGNTLNSDYEQTISNLSVTGRYVMVYLLKSSDPNKFLSLAEVEVYGSSSSNPEDPLPTSSLWSKNGANINYTEGNVGIGINAIANYKLAVDGKVIAEEVKVEISDTWPDYVFTKGYTLPTLKEVERHILEKGHLMNIPSAKEVESNGIELGEMNKLLLEKIEELTLYVIKLQKEVNQLKSNKK